jgi:2-polyprenyl-3-methyl-5-hydroxy-6-metoxy-1,4-benzoquinol methylase
MPGTKEHCGENSASHSPSTMTSEPVAQCRSAEFDAVAANYRQMVDESVGITGENSDYFAAYKANYITRRVASRHASGKILDYGCGVGLLARHLKRCLPGMRVDGFDVSESSLEQIEPELRSQGIFTSSVERLGRDYGLVVMANVLHHVKPEERRAVIAEAAWHLNSGGKLVIFEHNPLNPLTRWAVSHCPFDEDAILLPSKEVRELCSPNLQLSSTDYIVFFPRWLAWLRPFEGLLGWCPVGAQHATTVCKSP